MKVVQCTVSYAPAGSPLRDVNAKTKVAARASKYNRKVDKINIYIPTLPAATSKSTMPTERAKSHTTTIQKGKMVKIGRAHV